MENNPYALDGIYYTLPEKNITQNKRSSENLYKTDKNIIINETNGETNGETNRETNGETNRETNRETNNSNKKRKT